MFFFIFSVFFICLSLFIGFYIFMYRSISPTSLTSTTTITTGPAPATSTTTTTTVPATTSTTSTTTTTTTAPATTSTTAVPVNTTIGPSNSNRTWGRVSGIYYYFNAGDYVQNQGPDAANEQYALSTGHDTVVTNNAPSIYMTKQVMPSGSNTLFAYKNGTYYCAPNTDIVNYGGAPTAPIQQSTLLTVLNTIKNDPTNNVAVINGNISPTAPAQTYVDSGTFTTDAAMLNMGGASDTWYTLFYGNTTFPYAYTLTSFTPSNS